MSTAAPAYLAHWGLAEAPFQLEPDPRFAYERADHREGLARILFGITQLGGLVVITGEIGAGKTLLSQTLRQTLDGEGFLVAEVANPPRTAAALLVGDAAGDGRRPGRRLGTARISGLIRAAPGRGPRPRAGAWCWPSTRRSASTRAPSTRCACSPTAAPTGPGAPVVLLGQPELTVHIERQPQVAQRVVVRYHLGNMTAEEVDAYALHRTRVAGAVQADPLQEASQAVYEETDGVPRLVNLLLANALFVARQPRRRADRRGHHPRPGRGPPPEPRGRRCPSRRRRDVRRVSYQSVLGDATQETVRRCTCASATRRSRTRRKDARHEVTVELSKAAAPLAEGAPSPSGAPIDEGADPARAGRPGHASSRSTGRVIARARRCARPCASR